MDTERLNAISHQVIGAAMEVHRAMGAGLLEVVYAECLAMELGFRGLKVEREVPVPLVYKGCSVRHTFRLDLLVEGELVVEVKAVDELSSVHQAQLLTYLKLTGLRLGMLMNFNVAVMREGVKRVVNGL